LLARIQKYKDLGFDGYVSGQSIHYPGVTFGIVAFEKGQYSINPGI